MEQLKFYNIRITFLYKFKTKLKEKYLNWQILKKTFMVKSNILDILYFPFISKDLKQKIWLVFLLICKTKLLFLQSLKSFRIKTGLNVFLQRFLFIQDIPKKSSVKDFYERLGHIFQTRFLILQSISTSFQKEIGILIHIAKKLQAQQFSQNYLSEKIPGSKKFFVNFFALIFLKVF